MMEARFRPPAVVRYDAFDVVGLEARTTRQREAHPANAEIPRLWQRFFDENISRRVTGAVPGRVATVYRDYATSGEYSVVLGPVARSGDDTADGLVRVHVPAGRYLVFTVDGMPPEAMIAAWSRIDDWFAAEPQYRRAFRVDFEMLQPGATTICVSIAGDEHDGP
ncbi:MAG TPA: effector binding domain-containing protein [Vicinamibacterales bacterium]|nr:effector binding domain-containing protein [Vicinamibacterales bacterium]